MSSISQMTSQKCIKCGQVKDLSEFHVDRGKLSGHSGTCKACAREYDKKRYTPDVVRQKYIKNRAYALKYTQENRESIAEYRRKYNQEHKEEMSQKAKIKRQTNFCYRVNNNIQVALHRILSDKSGKRNSDYFESILPFNLFKFRSHIEKQFTSEMSWDNYAEYWELDHIIPKSQLVFSSYEDDNFKICWSLANLRPISRQNNLTRVKDSSDISNEVKQRIIKEALLEYASFSQNRSGG